MNANTNGRLNKARHTPNLTVAPVTRAIRSALAISATLLALGGSGAAIAQGVCTFTTPTTVSCDGAFTNTVPGSFFTPVADLTLVLGDSAPTSVTPAVGLMGIDANWSGSVGVTSYADITTVGATGIFAYSTYTATVNNQGSITTNVTAYGAKAMDVNAYGDVSVVNNGPVNAYSTGVYDVTAVNAYSSHGTVSVDNQAAGTITATAQDGNAIAVNALGYGAVTVTNEGAITASSVNGIAVGILAQSYNGNVSVTNSGSITATSTNGQAVGVLVSGDSAYVLNSGSAASITATSGSDAAIGIEAYGHAGAFVYNTGGSITATSNGGTATGILAEAYKGAARITNTGSIQATSLYYSPAVGVEAYSAFSGAATVTNSGNIVATAVSGNATGIIAQAHYGQVVVVNSGDVSATAGVGTYYQHNRAIGIVASSGAGYSPGITHVTNSGNIAASGPTLGEGIEGSARYGDLTITNTATGTITAYGQDEAIGIGTGHNGHNSFGRYYDDFTSQANIYNAGSITATANGTHCGACRVNATGIQIFLDYGNNVTVTNSGDIAVSVLGTTTNLLDDALGIDAVTYKGNITVNNSGSISVTNNTAALYTDYTAGILANTASGDISVVNSGDINISASSEQKTIWNVGISEVSAYRGNDGGLSVANSGNININSTGGNDFGIYAFIESHSSESGISVTNSGNININSTGASWEAGIDAFIQTGDESGAVAITNSGNININSTAPSGEYGIRAAAYVFGDVAIDNSGSIAAVNALNGYGILATFNGGIGSTATITNSGDISLSGSTDANGIATRYNNRDSLSTLVIDNSGSISARVDNGTHDAYVTAYGIQTRAGQGATTITNSGSIAATVSADPLGTYATAFAEGMLVVDVSNYLVAGDGAINITNTGSITASDISNGLDLLRQFNGWQYNASGIIVLHGYGTVDVANAGIVSASAQTDAAAVAGATISANAIWMAREEFGSGTYSQGSMTLSNSKTGSITASATSNYADVSTVATGVYTALGLSSASIVYADRGITIDNAGLVSATATVGGADTLGSATATGISALSWSDGFVDITNTGKIYATATTSGAATATGIAATGYSVAVALNTGSVIDATATGATGTATGLSLTNTGTAALTTNNAGVLMATFNGTGGKAYGAMITSAGDLTFTNSGHILATNATSAVGVDLISPTAVTLTNSGTITAASTAAGSIACSGCIAVLVPGLSNDTITNTGTINGAIQTGAGNDVFTNAVGGIWNAVGTSTFGAGDDGITNAGTIHMNNATINLGSFTLGNQFVNSGLITLLGSNTIAMGTGTSVNPNAVNPNPFTNNGTLDFQSGVPGNLLTIAGNFAGDGQIDVDVSGLHGTSDLLQIDGNVIAGSVNTVNVRLLDDPTTASTTIPLVDVTGTAAAGSFVLGQVIQNKSFLGLSYSLLNNVGTNPDPVFSLGLTETPQSTSIGVAVTGLSALGTLAASAAPGAQSLMNSQIGTLEDRMGAVSQTIKGGLSLWTRAFADSGTVDPGHSAGNFGQNGNFGFDQSNSGEEVGLDFAISDEFKAGALLAKAQASQSLDGSESDSSRITGNTSGVYGTWIGSNGFYVDASYRWMTFNDRLNSPTGHALINGDADAFNLEAGKTWTLQNGLQIAPQFQYTLTKVDNINSLTGSLAGFESNGDDASRARLGVMFSKIYTPSSGSTTWMPYASLSAVEEMDGKNSYSVNDDFFGETTTRGTSVLAEAGVNVQIGTKLALFGGVNWQDGGALKSFFGGQVGLRYTW